MELIKLTHDNIDREHICCAISSNKDVQVMSKKAWLKERLDEGLVFLKGNVRGKCFIEYIPAEYAWAPVEAEGYMVIDCLWVSGQFKGHGYSNFLLDACIKDSKAKGKKGLVILSSKTKLGFLSDPGYMRHKGAKYHAPGIRALLHQPVPVYGEICAGAGAHGKGAERRFPGCPYPDQRGSPERSLALYHLLSVL